MIPAAEIPAAEIPAAEIPAAEIPAAEEDRHEETVVRPLDRFDALVKTIRPYLWVVNLNGMRPEGPKILPFGTGTHEQQMLQRILE
jgi:hypothetical protein